MLNNRLGCEIRNPNEVEMGLQDATDSNLKKNFCMTRDCFYEIAVLLDPFMVRTVLKVRVPKLNSQPGLEKFAII